MPHSSFGRAILIAEHKSIVSPDESVGPAQAYLAEKLRYPGMISAQLYQAKEGDDTIALFEADTLETFRGHSKKSQFMFGEEIYRSHPKILAAHDTPLLLAVWWLVPADRDLEFGNWYEQEHIGMLTACEEWKMVRRIRLIGQDPKAYNHLALHYLESDAALCSPEREAARKTVWRNRLAREPWFEAAYGVFARSGGRLNAKAV